VFNFSDDQGEESISSGESVGDGDTMNSTGSNNGDSLKKRVLPTVEGKDKTVILREV